MIPTTQLDVFAGIPVSDYAAALPWYERLLGFPPAFFPHDTEAVWELAEHRYLYVVQQPEHAGHARHTLFAHDFDARVAQITGRGLEPLTGKPSLTACARSPGAIPDVNEIGFGGAPV